MRVAVVSGTAAFPEMAPETDEAGHYRIGSIPAGTFQVAVHDRDGETVGLDSVVVQSEETATLDISIAVDLSMGAPLPRRPVMRLRSAGWVHGGVEGTYCWPDFRADDGSVVGLCADKIRFGELSSAIPVEQGSSVTIEVEAEAPAQALSAGFYELDSDTQVKSLELGSGSEVEFTVDLPEGVYNLAVFGRWSDGDITYEFRIEVRPSSSGKAKEPTEGLCLPAVPLAVTVGDTWTTSGPVEVPAGFPSELPPDVSKMSSTFVVSAIGTATYSEGRGSPRIEHPRIELNVTTVTLDAEGNELTTEDNSGSWVPASVGNLGPVLTPDWECHRKAVFTDRQPFVIPAQGVDETLERHHGYDKLTGRVVLQQATSSGTRNGEPFSMDMLQELVKVN